MAFFHIQYHSSLLDGEGELGVILPERFEDTENCSMLILLHGAFSEYKSSLVYSSIARICGKRNMVIVAPSSHLGVYCDMVHGEKGFTMMKEALRVSRNLFPFLPEDPEKRYILGISMGGYGAYRLAMESPDAFAAVAACSSPLDMVATMELLESGKHFGGAELFHTFGSSENCRGTEKDVIGSLREHHIQGHKLPRMLLCWGDNDHAKGEDLAIVEKFRTAGIPLITMEGKGGHDFDMWDPLLITILDWMQKGGTEAWH